MEKNELLLTRLNTIDFLRATGGNWMRPLERLIDLCPKETRKKIDTFMAARQRQNVRALNEYLTKIKSELDKTINTPAEKGEKGQEATSNLQILGQVRELVNSINEYMAMVEARTDDDLFDEVWNMLMGEED